MMQVTLLLNLPRNQSRLCQVIFKNYMQPWSTLCQSVHHQSLGLGKNKKFWLLFSSLLSSFTCGDLKNHIWKKKKKSNIVINCAFMDWLHGLLIAFCAATTKFIYGYLILGMLPEEQLLCSYLCWRIKHQVPWLSVGYPLPSLSPVNIMRASL